MSASNDDFLDTLPGTALSFAATAAILCGAPGTVCLLVGNFLLPGGAGILAGLIAAFASGGVIGYSLEKDPNRKYATTSIFALSNMMLGLICFSIIHGNPEVASPTNCSCNSTDNKGLGALGLPLVITGVVMTKENNPVRRITTRIAAARRMLRNG